MARSGWDGSGMGGGSTGSRDVASRDVASGDVASRDDGFGDDASKDDGPSGGVSGACCSAEASGPALNRDSAPFRDPALSRESVPPRSFASGSSREGPGRTADGAVPAPGTTAAGAKRARTSARIERVVPRATRKPLASPSRYCFCVPVKPLLAIGWRQTVRREPRRGPLEPRSHRARNREKVQSRESLDAGSAAPFPIRG